MRRVLGVLLPVVVVAVLGIVAIWSFSARDVRNDDVTRLNDATQRVAANWPDLDLAGLDEVGAEVSVVSAAGQLLASTAVSPITDELSAARSRALAAPVVVDEQIVAMVYVASGLAQAQAELRNQLAGTATVAIVLVVGFVVVHMIWVQWRIVAPFRALQGFATRVASGDLDAPLTMDRGNVFGAWTESFDLMRSELAAARERAAEVEQSKRDLVAQISHDIRTPVAAIAATTEVLRLHTTEPAELARLEVITAKTTQVEQLIADLFTARDAELAALQVTVQDLASTRVAELLRTSDHAGRLKSIELPDCLVSADPHRLSQVFDNIIANSYKYADTAIEVAARLAGDSLELTISDDGPGVPADEVAAIFARGVRGSNVGDQPGHGLGLFTAAYLMERMGGDISAANTSDGFAVSITMPLA